MIPFFNLLLHLCYSNGKNFEIFTMYFVLKIETKRLIVRITIPFLNVLCFIFHNLRNLRNLKKFWNFYDIIKIESQARRFIFHAINLRKFRNFSPRVVKEIERKTFHDRTCPEREKGWLEFHAGTQSWPTVDISPNLSRKTNSNCGPKIPMRLCIIDYARPRITFTVPWKCLVPSPSSSSSGEGRNALDFVHEQRRSRPTNPYNNLAPIHHRSAKCCTCKMLANRGESVRKLVELQPLPVIKSKERRRYGRRATV